MRAALPLFNFALSRSLRTLTAIPKNVPPCFYHPSQKSPLQLQASSEPEDPETNAMETFHLRLGQIFVGTTAYIFQVTKNVRFYSWTKTEVETLFTDLVDSMDQGDERYELNQILVLREKREGLKDPVFEVADGQQRLITLALLYSAIRDCDCSEDGELRDTIQNHLVVKPYGKKPQLRITLRHKHNRVLRQLLEGKRVLKKDTAEQRDEVQQRIVDNYCQLLGMVKEKIESDQRKKQTSDEQNHFCSKFYQFLCDQVYVYLTIPKNQYIARKLVGGARRGQDAEPIDEFKAICVFRGIQDEKRQDEYLDKWMELEEDVSRKLLQEASLLIAQAEIGQRCKRNGEVDMLEDYWKASPKRDGLYFFDRILSPGAHKLYHFRNEPERQLLFLRDISVVTIVKPIEIPIMSLLAADPEYIESSVPVLERISLLFATTKLTLAERYRRSFEITQAIQDKKPLQRFDVSRIEAENILHSLDTTEWGSSPQPRKIITAVLRRLEAVITEQESESLILTSNASLEHILPQKPNSNSQWNEDWKESDKQRWVNRLGNFCILNGKKNSKANNRDFSKKKETYRSTVFPLTREIADKMQWTPIECENNHKHLLLSCKRDFGFDERLQGN